MKKWLLFFALTSWQLFLAQNSESRCRLLLKETDSLVSVFQYDKARVPFESLRKDCPKFSEKTYILGADILKNQLRQVPEDKKQAAVREILAVYDQHKINFPNNAEPLQLKKAMVLHENNLGSEDEIYALLDVEFKTNPIHFKNPEALYLYFDLYFKKYKKGEKAVSISNVLARRDDLEINLGNLRSSVSADEFKATERVFVAIDRLLNKEIGCEQLGEYYEKTFETRKSDTLWIANSARRLYQKSCLNLEILKKLSVAALELKPDSQSAYNLGILAFRKGEVAAAATYLEQSADLALDKDEKSATYFLLATSVYGIENPAKAKQALLKSLQAQPKLAKAHLFMAQLYASAGKECTKTEFERKVLYLLAAESVKKAALADPTMKAGTEKTLASYLEKAPSAKEIKAEKMAGKSVSFGCWINESVVLSK